MELEPSPTAALLGQGLTDPGLLWGPGQVAEPPRQEQAGLGVPSGLRQAGVTPH